MGTKRKLPFGYKMESGRVVIDSVEKSWVLHLFSRYNMGVSIRELTEFMNNTAVPYDPGKPWNRYQISGRQRIPGFDRRSRFPGCGRKAEEKSPASTENGCTDGAAEKMRVQDYTVY